MKKRRGDGEEMLHYLHDTPPCTGWRVGWRFLGGGDDGVVRWILILTTVADCHDHSG